MEIIDKLTAPPLGWQFTEPRTGWTGTGITFEQLIGRVAQHRANMKFRIVSEGFDTLQLEIEDAICKRMGDKYRDRICKEPGLPVSIQPGSLFSSMIHKITGRYASTCGTCLHRMQEMNSWGWWGCWKQRHTILSWISEEAKKRGHSRSDSELLTIFRAAFSEVFHHERSLKMTRKQAK